MTSVEEVNTSSDSDDDAYDAPPTGAPRRAVMPEGLMQFYRHTKNLFSPLEKQTPRQTFPQIPDNPHPGTEGVSFEEAIEKCPHLAEKYKYDATPVTSEKDGRDSRCPHRDDDGMASTDAASKCPYKNDVASQEWPMRAVLMFIAYNVISSGVNIEAIKIAFVIGAYHMGMLHPSEFVTVYLATAAMSSYKLLGLMLMLTNRGGPSLSYAKQYAPSPLILLHSCLIIVGSILVTGLSMRWAKWMDYFKEENQTDLIDFSIVDHIFIPIASEFVFRGFLLKEMGRDLGSWFGIIGASGWCAMLKRGQLSIKYAAFIQGVLWSLCTKFSGGNLIPATVGHVCMASLRALLPSVYFAFYPEGV